MKLGNHVVTNNGLRRKEEYIKSVLRSQLAGIAGLLEVLLAIIVLIALLISIVPLIELLPSLFMDDNGVGVHDFLVHALDIVIGIEFVKMLAKHSPGSVLEVLLTTIARNMIVGHGDALQNLISVGAIALIFIIRRYLYVPAFGHALPAGEPELQPETAEVH